MCTVLKVYVVSAAMHSANAFPMAMDPCRPRSSHNSHVCLAHILVVFEVVSDLLDLALKVLVPHDSVEQVRVTAGVHAFVVGEGPRQILAAINLID